MTKRVFYMIFSARTPDAYKGRTYSYILCLWGVVRAYIYKMQSLYEHPLLYASGLVCFSVLMNSSVTACP